MCLSRILNLIVEIATNKIKAALGILASKYIINPLLINNKKLMKKIFTVLGTLALLAMPAFASAAPTTGQCVQGVHDIVVLLLDSPSDTDTGMGDAISDGFFGNEPNMLNTNTNLDLGPNEVEPGTQAGNVAPSLSPGPGTVGGGFTTWGSLIKGVVPASCS